ncbi:cation:proton antiporter [Bacteroidota bacterium]
MNNYFLNQIIIAIPVEPILSKLVFLSISIILIGLILKVLKQPYVVAYIIAGIIMGPNGLKIVMNEVLISDLGSFGLILLLFFIGMEISLPSLIAKWQISVIGTFIQVIFSIGAVWLVGLLFSWSIQHIIIFGFVISLSSTAVVIKLLQDRNESNTKVGQNAIGILLAQDILIVPMLIILNYISGKTPHTIEILKQIIGGILIIGIIFWILKRKQIRLPFDSRLKDDHELQVFFAFSICFGFSILTAFFHLSPALGAFIAGIIVSSAKAAKWVQDSLHAFRIVFVALFFVSIGMLIDLQFLRANLLTLLIFIVLVLLTNTFINAIIMRIFGESWQDSIYTGSILAQIGEFSFILGATGFLLGIITEYMYQLIISIISLTLILSPIWVFTARKLVSKK